MKKASPLSVSLSEKLEKRLDKFATSGGKSRSAVVADALRYYFLSQEFNLLQQALTMRANILGVSNETDVDKIVHSFRK
jgi:metal-responsive CopG/Arc/MetJ family transcriptional regulator